MQLEGKDKGQNISKKNPVFYSPDEVIGPGAAFISQIYNRF